MTIDEAIAHARETAINQRNNDKLNKTLGEASPYYKTDCLKCAEEHEQLAEWLEELKRRREYDGEIIGSGALKNAYNKAIDDFKSRLEERILSGKMIDEKFAYIDNSDIDEIAEQLKAGGTDA